MTVALVVSKPLGVCGTLQTEGTGEGPQRPQPQTGGAAWTAARTEHWWVLHWP